MELFFVAIGVAIIGFLLADYFSKCWKVGYYEALLERTEGHFPPGLYAKAKDVMGRGISVLWLK